MDKLKMQTADLTEENIKKIAEIFPSVVTEAEAENGQTKKAIDFDLLRQELSTSIVEGGEERYRLDWPGKRVAILKANTPIADKTLRPVPGESVDFEKTENLYIEGDNFQVLKLLQESYLGHDARGTVKMIYIDPPYNTGKDFVYRDNFTQDKDEYDEGVGAVDKEGNKLFKNTETNGRFHSDWLTMMYERLTVARDILRDDGVIFISIDDNEITNLKKICDEIFGEENFKANIVWRKTHTQTNIGDFARVKEYILVYAKDIVKSKFNRIALTNLEEYRYEDEIGKFRRKNLSDSTRGRYEYTIINPNGNKVSGKWMMEKNDLLDLINTNRVYWAGETPYGKNYLHEMQKKGQIANDLIGIELGTNQRSTMHLDDLLGGRIFDFPKPIDLIKYFLVLQTNKDDIILDFFSGSATSAHAVMKLNVEDEGSRKFIMVQLPEETDKESEAYRAGYKNLCEVGKERIRRAAKKIQEDNKDKNLSGIDFGFRVYKLDSTNMKDVYYSPAKLEQKELLKLEDNIKADRSPEDLLTQVMLDLGIMLSAKIESRDILGNKVFFVEDNALVACFDKKINFNIVDEIAKAQPLRVVFRDAGFVDDKDRINVEERFKRLSPETVIKVL